jgi:hypothetical protein
MTTWWGNFKNMQEIQLLQLLFESKPNQGKILQLDGHYGLLYLVDSSKSHHENYIFVLNRSNYWFNKWWLSTVAEKFHVFFKIVFPNVSNLFLFLVAYNSSPTSCRTTVEMEPHTGELYTVQQGPGGGVRMAKSSRVRDDVYAGRRPTHIAEAR